MDLNQYPSWTTDNTSYPSLHGNKTTPLIVGTAWPHYPPDEDEWKKEKDIEELKNFITETTKKTKKQEENVMKVYEVIVVDKKECEILNVQKIVAKNTETAMLDLELAPDVKKKVKKNQIEFIFNELGEFKKTERKIKAEAEEED